MAYKFWECTSLTENTNYGGKYFITEIVGYKIDAMKVIAVTNLITTIMENHPSLVCRKTFIVLQPSYRLVSQLDPFHITYTHVGWGLASLSYAIKGLADLCTIHQAKDHTSNAVSNIKQTQTSQWYYSHHTCHLPYYIYIYSTSKGGERGRERERARERERQTEREGGEREISNSITAPLLAYQTVVQGFRVHPVLVQLPSHTPKPHQQNVT